MPGRSVTAFSLVMVRALAVHATDLGRLYAAIATGVWVSADGGRRWGQPPGGLRTPAAGLVVVPGLPALVIAATADGIFEGDALVATAFAIVANDSRDSSMTSSA